MPESGLNLVQTWLWSELDDLGIDGVIYCRHILDLLIGSKHTFDHRLEEKEENIFSKIAPGAKRRKQKYSRRSSSFSACEEILWKKEIAVSCLLSATETKKDSEDAAATIQHVVDELYNKLAELHLTSEGKRSGSDGDCPLTDHNGNSVTSKKKPTKKENYEDAFPSLDGTTLLKVSGNLSGSVWNKAEKSSDSKSALDSDNSGTHLRCRNPLPCCNSNGLRSRSEGEVTPDVISRNRHPHPMRNSNWRNVSAKKTRAASTGCADAKTAHSSNVAQSRKPPRSRYTYNGRTRPRYRRSEHQKKVSEKSSPQKRKFTEFKRYNRKMETSKRAFQKNLLKKNLSILERKNYVESREQDYAYLPSWMETTLADISNPYGWSSYEGGWMLEGRTVTSTEEEEEETEDPPFSNRWYREPDSGLLTFQPLKSGIDRLSSSSSTTLSRPPSSLYEDQEEDELFQDEESDSDALPAPESWMWCPSPSLWEDGQSSPVSRLESVYKRELLSLGAENHVEDISGRIWEEYKTIFQDLQDMDDESDDESSDEDPSSFVRPDSSIWAPMANESILSSCASGFPSVNDSEKARNHKFATEPTRGRFDLWSESSYASSDKSVIRNSSYDSLATSSLGEPVIHKSASSESNIWKYSPAQAWSADDGLDQGDGVRKVQPDEELALLMQNGVFGYLCQARKPGECSLSPMKNNTLYPCHGGQWGDGDFTAIEKPDTPSDKYEEEMMHTLVDALFSDHLSFELLFNPKLDPQPHTDTSHIPSKTPVTPFDPEFPASLSFDFRSLFVQNPTQNFSSPGNNPWRPQWHMDDIVAQAGLNYLSPFTKLDDLFLSLASAEEVDRQYGRLSETARKKSSFYDSITENEAWKTSVRVGNIWQTISGIRPVNVIYSENKPTPQREEKLIPSAATHFRPISTALVDADVNDPSGYDSVLSIDSPIPQDEPNINSSEQHYSAQVGLTEHSGSGNTFQLELPEAQSFQTSFRKLVQDKSMQTAFEISVQQDISSCQEFLPRPPKANSR